jgi:hypothetical protein
MVPGSITRSPELPPAVLGRLLAPAADRASPRGEGTLAYVVS